MKGFVEVLCPASKPSSGTISLLVLITVAILNCWWFLFLPHQQPDLLITFASTGNQNRAGNCDLWRGQWVPDLRPPLYTNDTCRYIETNQNCMLNGRPDRGYLNWQWKPKECGLPQFDPKLFLELMRGKKMVFIGDSIARNHMQALLCALAQVEDPQNVSDGRKAKEYIDWDFPSYNFTLGNLWSIFLVNHTVEQGIYKIHLDMPDVVWSSRLANYDIAVISTGYWYFRPSIYYMNNKTLGAKPDSGVNLTTFGLRPAFRIALGTVLKYMVSEYRGIPILRTVTVPHFEDGTWGNGGACNQTQPLFDPDMELPLPWMSQQLNKIQREEFMKAVESKQGLGLLSKLQLLDVTYSSFLRPDGHPGPYRIQHPNELRNDCLHWCLPGPIDMWNQLILDTIQRLADLLTNGY